MNYKIIFLSLLISNLGFSQVNTIIDSLDNPIAMAFVDDEVFVVLHGSLPEEGKIVSFNVTDPQTTYQVHFDSLTYPRAIIEKDSIIEKTNCSKNCLLCRKTYLVFLYTFFNINFNFFYRDIFGIFIAKK